MFFFSNLSHFGFECGWYKFHGLQNEWSPKCYLDYKYILKTAVFSTGLDELLEYPFFQNNIIAFYFSNF